MTLEEFTADLDRYIKRGWPEGDHPGLLFAATLAERITPLGNLIVGPGYEFVIEGSAYEWSGYDGWNPRHRPGQAGHLFNLAASKWLDDRAGSKVEVTP